jgi:RNA polymerase primary sigma factor/RNA polymerase sigma factor
MARPRQFRLPAFEDLSRQLRFAPAARRRQQMDAAERLVGEIEPDQAYPHEYIVFRITNFRPETDGEPHVYDGAAVLIDLVNFVQRASRELPLTEKMAGTRTPIAVADLPRRLGVSSKTVQRYREFGLVCHYLDRADGRRQLVCFDDALNRFLEHHRDRVNRAQQFTRIDDDVEDEIIDAARRLRLNSRTTLNDAARVLAERYGRAHETIRGLLRRHDRDADAPIFDDRGPLTDRDMRLIGRAVQWGVAPARLARRYGKSSSTIQRAIARARTVELRNWPKTWLELPTFARADAEAVILNAPAVTQGLNNVIEADQALTLIERIRAFTPGNDTTEGATIAAYHLLKRRAAARCATPGNLLSMTDIDRIETDLRWATWLKWRLVSFGLPAALQSLEQALHQSLDVQAGDEIVALLALAVRAVAGDIETVDPSQGHHLQRRAGLVVARAAALAVTAEDRHRAAARHAPGRLPLPDVFRHLTPWQQSLSLSPARREAMAELPEDIRMCLVQRYGLAGSPPATLEELAAARTVRVSHVRRMLRDVWRNDRSA